MLRTIGFLRSHPLTRANPLGALARFAGWQIGSRICPVHTHRWIEGAKLVVRNGMTGATGNIYCGLHEFADMGFLLHVLRPGDLFLDIGANIGSYTVLASGVCGARTIAFEPDPDTAVHFRRNVEANRMEERVALHTIALGRAAGEVAFTTGQDTTNRVANRNEENVRMVGVKPLDEIAGADHPVIIKLDVEGYEAEVLAGAVRTLSTETLIAIETEAQDSLVTALIEKAGFVRRWYDPFSRTLSKKPLEDLPASNALFIRNESDVAYRLASAPKRKVLDYMI